MKTKIYSFVLILSSLIGYLEWGTGQHAFLWEAEWEVLQNLINGTKSVIHPFTIIPLMGQILLMVTLFQKQPSRIITYIGIACIGLLLLLMAFIGVISLSWKIFFSVVPFITLSILTIRHHRKNTVN